MTDMSAIRAVIDRCGLDRAMYASDEFGVHDEDNVLGMIRYLPGQYQGSVRLLACAVAMTVAKYSGEHMPAVLAAIKTSRRYVVGEACEEDIRQARIEMSNIRDQTSCGRIKSAVYAAYYAMLGAPALGVWCARDAAEEADKHGCPDVMWPHGERVRNELRRLVKAWIEHHINADGAAA